MVVGLEDPIGRTGDGLMGFEGVHRGNWQKKCSEKRTAKVLQ